MCGRVGLFKGSGLGVIISTDIRKFFFYLAPTLMILIAVLLNRTEGERLNHPRIIIRNLTWTNNSGLAFHIQIPN